MKVTEKICRVVDKVQIIIELTKDDIAQLLTIGSITRDSWPDKTVDIMVTLVEGEKK